MNFFPQNDTNRKGYLNTTCDESVVTLLLTASEADGFNVFLHTNLSAKDFYKYT